MVIDKKPRAFHPTHGSLLGGLLGCAILLAGAIWAANTLPAHSYSSNSAPLMMAGSGGLILAVSVYGYHTGRRRLELRAWLGKHGRSVWVPSEHTRVRITFHDPETNRPSIFVVDALWTDPATGRTHTATSAHLRDDPTTHLRSYRRVLVRYDPADPARCLVDLAEP
ncbi:MULTISPECIES: hypothetical protein [unclassified Nocardia]|uniref:hypothetical protein n=1 Tax=unclassified Nocardia TaxID=2637762 RepID=UPI001CE4B0A3|nr:MULTISPECIES: hypothetical protein [unclassified Nocardia]